MRHQPNIEGTLKKGTPYKVSIRGHNNFFYPGEKVFHAIRDIAYSRVVGWLSFDGLRPVKIESNQLSEPIRAQVNEKYSVIWITI